MRVTHFDCMPMVADVFSGAVDRPTEYTLDMDPIEWARHTPAMRGVGADIELLTWRDAAVALTEGRDDGGLLFVVVDEGGITLSLVALNMDGTHAIVVGPWRPAKPLGRAVTP